MRRLYHTAIPLSTLLLAAPAAAQNTPAAFRDEALRHFEGSSRKITQLAEAMPADLYTWSPMEGVMPVAQVFMHIARYNYLYLSENLGMPLPDDVDMDTMEAVTDKATVQAMVAASIEYTRRHLAAMQGEDLVRMTRQYGRDVPPWSVMFQLVAHMNEHVGQSVAYARMNGVAPPWSRP
ncbi:MAG TPA: DinB family protein [Gemmatimonadales bacterium]